MAALRGDLGKDEPDERQVSSEEIPSPSHVRTHLATATAAPGFDAPFGYDTLARGRHRSYDLHYGVVALVSLAVVSSALALHFFAPHRIEPLTEAELHPTATLEVPASPITAHGLVVDTIKPGTGPSPTAADVVLVNYVAHLGNGKEFDKGDKVAIPLDAVVPGFSQGVQKMQKGGKYKLTIPANLGYGDKATGPIPANSELVFDIELLDYMNAAQLRQMQQMQLQGMREKGVPGGVPGGMPPDAMPPGGMPPGARSVPPNQPITPSQRDEQSANAADQIVQQTLAAARVCYKQQNYDCAEADVNTVLRINPSEGEAGLLMQSIKRKRQEALQSNWDTH